jgi:ABC-type uncharacterized transport system permease subunit
MADGVETILLMYVSIALTTSMVFTVRMLDAQMVKVDSAQFSSSDAWEPQCRQGEFNIQQKSSLFLTFTSHNGVCVLSAGSFTGLDTRTCGVPAPFKSI